MFLLLVSFSPLHGFCLFFSFWRRLQADGDEQTEDLMLQQLKRLIKTNFDAKKVRDIVLFEF